MIKRVNSDEVIMVNDKDERTQLKIIMKYLYIIH